MKVYQASSMAGVQALRTRISGLGSADATNRFLKAPQDALAQANNFIFRSSTTDDITSPMTTIGGHASYAYITIHGAASETPDWGYHCCNMLMHMRIYTYTYTYVYVICIR